MTPLPVLHTPAEAVAWLRQRVRGQLRADSRQIVPGDGLLAWPGAAADARAHLDAAVRAGAAACLAQAEGAGAFAWGDVTRAALALVPDLKRHSGAIASLWHGEPSQALDVAAVTGTNGKTSVSWWVAHAMRALGRPFGLVGTLGVGLPPALEHTGLTSPDPLRLHASLAAMRQAGAGGCVMEASSIGLAEGRLNGTCIQVAAFTNFTQDHLDYHGSMEAYWQAKTALFSWPGLRAAVVNLDDAHGARLARQLRARPVQLWGYAVETGAPAAPSPAPGEACLLARQLQFTADGVRFELVEPAATPRSVAVHAPVTGLFNVHNLLAVVGVLRALGVDLPDAARALAQLPPVPGRLERAGGAGQPLVVVDYAHTPDAIEAVLRALRPVARQRGGALVCVFGCGGNRDAGKRPLMAQAAVAGADCVWITSDNPRGEEPRAIIAQMLAGVPAAAASRVRVDADRRQAIAAAIVGAGAQDVVLVAGKGHEDYQEVQGQRHHFSDREEVQVALRLRNQRGEAAACA